MDVPGLEGIPCITRSDFIGPLFWEIFLREHQGQYEFVDAQPLGIEGTALFDRKIKNVSNTITDIYNRKVQQLLLSLDRKARENERPIRELRSRYNLPDNPLLLFENNADRNNELHIDAYTENIPGFKEDVITFCGDNLEIAINPRYSEEIYTAMAWVLFGQYIIDYTWEVVFFLADRVLHIIEKIQEGHPEQRNNESDHIYAFDQRLLSQILSNLQQDEDGFIRRLELLLEGRADYSDIVIAIIPNLYLLSVYDDTGNVGTRYLQMPATWKREHCYTYIEPFDIAPKANTEFDIEIINSTELFGQNLPQDYLGDKLWLRMPSQRIGIRKSRKIFTAFNTRRSEMWGQPFEPRINAYTEKHLIMLIEYMGLYGTNRRTAPQILDDPTLAAEEISETALAQLKKRARELNRLGEREDDMRLFITPVTE